jgi:beta-lactamase class D
MRIVKEIMVQEKNSNYTLAYKTGWGFTPNGNALGWLVGWIIENKHPYFIVLNVEGAHDLNMIPVRLNITKGILRKLGFLEGKM